MADDTNEIQVAAEHFLRALDNLDWERFGACWSADPSAFYPGDDTRVDGRAAVLTRFRTMFEEIPLRASGPPYLNLKPRNLRINRYGEAGLVTFMIPDRPGPTLLRSLLFVREAGAWKLAHLHATNRVLV
jgi:ketosteroid isomerase-like protein